MLKSESGSSPAVDISIFDKVRGKSLERNQSIHPDIEAMNLMLFKKDAPSKAALEAPSHHCHIKARGYSGHTLQDPLPTKTEFQKIEAMRK